MAVIAWQNSKIHYCPHAGCEVALEVQVVYPAEIMPEQPPRVLAHRCSHGLWCNLVEKPSCIWAGTNPDYDPFIS